MKLLISNSPAGLAGLTKYLGDHFQGGKGLIILVHSSASTIPLIIV